MEDERVDRLLAALPRETASAGFTQRVLARLDGDTAGKVPASGDREQPGLFGLPWLTLPAVVLAATVVVAASWILAGSLLGRPGGSLTPPAATETAALGLPASPENTESLPPQAATLGGAPREVETGEAPVQAAADHQASRGASRDRQALALMREIRAEHLRLDDELRALRTLQAGARTAGGATVYLGGDEDLEFVVHLDQVRDLRGPVAPPLE